MNAALNLTAMAGVIEQLTLRQAGTQAGVCYAALWRCERGEMPASKNLALILRWLDTARVTP